MKVAWLLLLATACQKAPTSAPPPATSTAASAATAPSVAAQAKPWFSGAWQGKYQAELFRLETAAGGVKDWKQDDGKRGSGDGTLSLQIGDDGSVSGNSVGALGELGVAGHVDGDRAALTLTSSTLEGFHGAILAERAASGMSGTLSASSGDSLTARRGSVTLSKAAP